MIIIDLTRRLLHLRAFALGTVLPFAWKTIMSKHRELSNGFNLAAKKTIITANIKLLTAFLRFIVLLKQIQATREKTKENAKHLSKGVFELRTSTGGEAFLIERAFTLPNLYF